MWATSSSSVNGPGLLSGDDDPAPAEDGHPVGDGAHLGELVGDDEDGEIAGCQAADDLEKRIDLLGRQGARRLVEDEEPGVGEERTDDLDLLTLGEAEMPNLPVGIDLSCPAPRRTPGEWTPAAPDGPCRGR